MRGIEIIDLKSLNFKEALFDETIFILKDHRQAQNGYPKGELRCSCRPLYMMTSKTLREVLDNIDECVAIKILE